MGSSATDAFGSSAFVLDLCDQCYHNDYTLNVYIHMIVEKNDPFAYIIRDTLMEIFMSPTYEMAWLSNELYDVDFDRICYKLIEKIDGLDIEDGVPHIYQEFKEYVDLYQNVLSKKD